MHICEFFKDIWFSKTNIEDNFKQIVKEETSLPPRPIKITPIFSKKNAELVQLEDEIKEEKSIGELLI